ncbi:MAG TPA: hypothetical protein VFE52_06970 [Devosia sp.]|jgi:ElaB/YqjD/DUF883 family membrane-anchored ribosome-binding protein|nr:hypothetical protein [Devosia sp.]
MAQTEDFTARPTTPSAPAARRAANGAATSTRARRARPNNDDLEAQIAQLQSDIRSITQTLSRMGEDKVEEMRSTAKLRAAELKGKGEGLVETAQDEFNAFEKQIKDTIREKPLTAVAGAIALGFILAVVTR